MYTGIVEGLGRIIAIDDLKNSKVITVQPEFICDDLKLGDSIAINGVCLTVSKLNETTFTADVVAETLAKTNLALLNVNDIINLERCLKVGDRLGGHFVSGHIDCKGKITAITPETGSYNVSIQVDKQFIKFIAPKGSVTIDGMSITIVSVINDIFTVTLIPHTLETTIAKNYQIDTKVNLEVDMLAKYLDQITSGAPK